MRKQQPKKTITKRDGAFVREVGRNSAVRPKEVVNLEAIFGEPNFEPTNLMEAVVERSNMIKALVQVEKNKGAPGVDGLRVEDLRAHFAKHWGQLKQWLLAGQYLPSPVRRVEIPKPNGGVRELGIPTSVDRVIR